MEGSLQPVILPTCGHMPSSRAPELTRLLGALEPVEREAAWADFVQAFTQPIRIYGNGTVAAVTALGSWTVEKGERTGQFSGRYTETWVKRDGQWQAVAGHYSDVPSPTSEP